MINNNSNNNTNTNNNDNLYAAVITAKPLQQFMHTMGHKKGASFIFRITLGNMDQS